MPPRTRKTTTGAGLPLQRFERLKEALHQAFDGIRLDVATRTKAALLSHSSDLAQCSTMQLQEIRKILAPYGAGFHLNDMIDKSVLHGEGVMARHLVTNGGITKNTFTKLPARDRTRLNSGVISIASRGRVIGVRAKDMTEKQTRRAVSGNLKRILTPHEQLHLPRQITPTYHSLTGDEPDGRAIILTCELNSSRFKVRITRRQLTALAKKYPTSSKPRP